MENASFKHRIDFLFLLSDKLFHMVLYGFPHKLLIKLASFFLKAKSLHRIFTCFLQNVSQN